MTAASLAGPDFFAFVVAFDLVAPGGFVVADHASAP
jgi:hypothetical protein